MELHFGEWEGRSYTELCKTHKNNLSRWFDDPFSYCPPGGETVNDLRKRVWPALEKVVDAAGPDETAVVISHGGSIRSILYQCLGLKPQEFWNISVDNGSISLLKAIGGKLQVVFYNSREHLDL